MMTQPSVHDVWVEVNLSALQHNFRQVRGALADGVRLMAVVKANGYGHGCVEPARAFVEAGADALAITRIEEALELRNSGITSPILLLAPIQPDNADAAVEAGLDMTVASLPLAQAISNAAQKLGKTAGVHIKIDTGMGRLGVLPREAVEFVESIRSLPSVRIAGVYTHFATAAESDIGPSRAQLDSFRFALKELELREIDFGLAHAANSAAILRMPDSHLDMARPGTLLFGQYPSKHVPRKLDLRSAFKLKARVCEVKRLPTGSQIGYGGEFITRRPTTIAVVPVGWADGFTLAPEGPIYRQSVIKLALRKMRRKVSAEIHGRKVPVIGRVAMQMTVLDVTGIAGIQVGDEVTLPAMRIPVSAIIPRVYASLGQDF